MGAARLGWLLAVVFGLSSILGEGDAESALPPLGSAVRQRDRARVGAGHSVAHRRALKRSRPRGTRIFKRVAAAQAEPNPSEAASVTLTSASKGTSFYVDSRRVGTGSTVHQTLQPGYHHVQAVHPSGARWQRYVSFDPGENRKLIVNW